MRADQDVVVEDLRMVVGDKPHAAHVSRQRIHLINPPCGLDAILPPAQVEHHEFVRFGCGVFWMLEIYAAYPYPDLSEKKPGDVR